MLRKINFMIFASVFIGLKFSWASLMPTTRTQYQSIHGWEIQGVDRLGSMSCRAEKKTSQMQLTIIYSPMEKYQNKKWYVGFTSKKHRMPGKLQEVPGKVLIQEKKVLDGKFLRVGDWKGGKRAADYIRAEFLTDDISAMERKGSWVLVSETKPAIQLKVNERGDSAIKALKECMQKQRVKRKKKWT